MGMVTFSVTMDEELKTNFDKLCDKLGINASIALNILARTVVREQKIPFEIMTKVDNKGLNAFNVLRMQAKENGVQDLPLDSINEEINSVRNSK